ncbi:MAG: GntR family transcriptional regulator, partial [Actinobacteria bacterium]|nr:GntR family transcriptional regulator [Actinomycetota bacterium]
MSEQDSGGNAKPAAAVAAGIRDAVFRGEYVPGQRLVEVELCDAFQASRSAVRGALQQLANEGLVEVQRNRGARVRRVSRDEAIEITEVRRMVEGLIAAKAASRASRQQVAELRELITAMRRAVRQHDALGYSELNAGLHAMVRQVAGHATAAAIIERLRGQVVRHQFRLALRPSRPDRSLAQHEKIVEAIASGDPDAAEAAMHEHLDDVLR